MLCSIAHTGVAVHEQFLCLDISRVKSQLLNRGKWPVDKVIPLIHRLHGYTYNQALN